MIAGEKFKERIATVQGQQRGISSRENKEYNV